METMIQVMVYWAVAAVLGISAGIYVTHKPKNK